MMRPLLLASAAIVFVAPARADELSADERKLVELVNAERTKAGLAALKPDARLMKAARGHSTNMARKNQIAHDLDDKGPDDRLKDVGYTHFGLGENCAAGQRTPAEAMTSWLDSPGHRANLLGADYREIGVGLAKAADGTVYWTQVFAVPGL